MRYDVGTVDIKYFEQTHTPGHMNLKRVGTTYYSIIVLVTVV